jgi:hypothetical protein
VDEKFVTEAECARMREEHNGECTRHFKELKDSLAVHDIQAKQICKDVNNVAGEIKDLAWTLREIAGIVKETAIIQKQASMDKVWYQKLIYRMIGIGASVLFILLGLKVAGVPI